MHVFPQLRKLEQKYEEELAVVGVHSAKFVAEKDTANLRKAVLRYEIEHPVVNDADFSHLGRVHRPGMADADVHRPGGQGHRQARG